MLLIHCPWCGERAEREFHYGGDASLCRPTTAEGAEGAFSPEWLEYIYLRDNPRGLHLEYWQHSTGCRRWFKAVRNTETHEFIATGDTGHVLAGGAP